MKDEVNLTTLAEIIHAANVRAGWWHDPETGEDLRVGAIAKYVDFTKLCLIHSEVSEAVEGHRKNLMDDKLQHRKMVEVELADVFIRALDFCGRHKLDIHGAIQEKLQYNNTRADHKLESRLTAQGKSV